MPELLGYPLGAFPGGQPERCRSVAGLVGPPPGQTQHEQGGVPDPFGDIAMIQRVAGVIAKDIVTVACELLSNLVYGVVAVK